MSVVKEIMGSSVLDRSSSVTLNNHFNQRNSVNPVLIPLEKRRIQVRKVVRTTPVAAISDNFFRFVPEEAVKFKVRAVVTVRNKNKEDFKETIVKQLDAFTDKIGRNVVLQLVSTEIDPKTKTPKKSKEAVLKDWSQKSNVKAERVNYTTDFMVDSNFGVPGAISVSNKHQKELFLENITLEGFACGPVHFPCNSWVQSNKKDHPSKRIFFFNTPWVGILLATVITLGVSYMEFTDIIGATNFLYSLGMLLEFASFVWLKRKFTASRIEFR